VVRRRLVRSFPILAASGHAGPKLREGDRQVPEGLYRIESLNPNSRFHLALRVGYPNASDLEHAAGDGRANLGGDIMIHGGAASIGCIAIGDLAIEEVFVLAAETGIERIALIIAPFDLRARPDESAWPQEPRWVPDLYRAIAEAMAPLERS
jgi:murein L,D-transpeptidase YafK